MDWTQSEVWKKGEAVEGGRFLRVFSVIDPNPREATKADQFKHIDWHTSIGTIDVKAMKKVTRSGKLQEEFMWVEFRNTVGMDGWLFGDQDWVAFEMSDGFTLVRTKQLLKLANELCDTETFVDSPRDALYKVYSRKTQDDVISMIRFSDIQAIPHIHIHDPMVKDEPSCFL